MAAAGLCPILTILGVLLGVRALIEIRANPSIGGRRLAIAAIVIGSLVTGAWIAGAITWHLTVRMRVEQGVMLALDAGQAGDVNGFMEGFSTADERAAQTFLRQVTERFGQLRSGEITGAGDVGGQRVLGLLPSRSDLEYSLQFERGVVLAQARYILMADGTFNRYAHLVIVDEVRGDLVYPPSGN